MSDLRIGVTRHSIALRSPYVLPFGTLDHLETFVIEIAGDGRIGLGEITPLPGYSDETPDSVSQTLDSLQSAEAEGVALGKVIDGLMEKAPFVGSGLACALDSWLNPELLSAPTLRRPVPLTGLVAGATAGQAAASARQLTSEGIRTFKLKAMPGEEAETLARTRAVLSCVPAGSVISLDANQTLSLAEAESLCRGLAELPVAWLEQPFAADAWEAHHHLAAMGHRIVLDESIHTRASIGRARSIGCLGVKLKLCKHRGTNETHDLLVHARALGLVVLFGNGVQSGLGNHFEAVLHATCGLETASEGNGFLKTVRCPVVHDVRLRNGVIEGSQLRPEAGPLETRASVVYKSRL